MDAFWRLLVSLRPEVRMKGFFITFGLAGVQLAKVLLTVGLDASPLAWVFYLVGEGVVYFWPGWPTCG